ncbi:MAG: dephospho-CoA kinase [Thermonemataceae bacterium]|nr:dephospho-CoA kinase [Thermonemataceae bacterium]
MKKALEIGITGGIGSGKSLISQIFKRLTIPIYDADSRAKYLMRINRELKSEIIKHFGNLAYTKEGELDRSYLAKEVFNDNHKRELINALVHPKVAEDYQNWLNEHAESPYVLREAALMIESGAYKTLDKLITVFAPQEVRIRRVQKRDPQRSEAEILAIMQKQVSEEEKIKLADFVIYNDDKQAVLPQVLKLHSLFSESSL